MDKKFDYEAKIYGGEGKTKYKLFQPWAFEAIPKEFNSVSGKVLDLGCGAGRFTNLIKMNKRKLTVYGIDISRNAIKTASKNFPDINFRPASVYHLPFKNNYFDAVVLRHVLEHLENPTDALEEINRILKPGGLFYSSTPLENDPLIISADHKYSEKYHGHRQFYSRNLLRELLEKEGFLIKRVYYYGFLIYQILEVVYYPILEALKLPVNFTVESYSNKNRKTLMGYITSVFKKLVTLLFNLETIIVPNEIPGLFMNVIAYKVKHQLNRIKGIKHGL